MKFAAGPVAQFAPECEQLVLEHFTNHSRTNVISSTVHLSSHPLTLSVTIVKLRASC